VLLRNIKPRSKLLYLKEKLLLCFTGAGKSTPPMHLFENLENSPQIPCESATPGYCSAFRIGMIAFLSWIKQQHHRGVWLRS
jgi:hypothetical protein